MSISSMSKTSETFTGFTRLLLILVVDIIIMSVAYMAASEVKSQHPEYKTTMKVSPGNKKRADYPEVIRIKLGYVNAVKVKKGDWALQILRTLGVKEEDLAEAINALVEEQKSFIGYNHPLIKKYEEKIEGERDKMHWIFPETRIYFSDAYAKRFGINIEELLSKRGVSDSEKGAEEIIRQHPRQHSIDFFQRNLFENGRIYRKVVDVKYVYIDSDCVPREIVTTEKWFPEEYVRWRTQQGKALKDEEKDRQMDIY